MGLPLEYGNDTVTATTRKLSTSAGAVEPARPHAPVLLCCPCWLARRTRCKADAAALAQCCEARRHPAPRQRAARHRVSVPAVARDLAADPARHGAGHRRNARQPAAPKPAAVHDGGVDGIWSHAARTADRAAPVHRPGPAPNEPGGDRSPWLLAGTTTPRRAALCADQNRPAAMRLA